MCGDVNRNENIMLMLNHIIRVNLHAEKLIRVREVTRVMMRSNFAFLLENLKYHRRENTIKVMIRAWRIW